MTESLEKVKKPGDMQMAMTKGAALNTACFAFIRYILEIEA